MKSRKQSTPLHPHWMTWIVLHLSITIMTTTLATTTGSSSSSPISMGTTILALRYKNGVIVAADTRSSVSGYVSNRFATKITFLLDPEHDSYLPSASAQTQTQTQDDASSFDNRGSTCCVCRSGSAADTQHVAEKTREQLLARQILAGSIHSKPTVTHAAHVIRTTVWNNPDLSCSLICAGYDHGLKRGIIYSITPGGTMMEEPIWAAGGSGSTYILGHLDRNYPMDDYFTAGKPNHETVEFMEEREAVQFVKKAIQLAMSRDGSSGGFIRLYVIDQYGKREMAQYNNNDENGHDRSKQPFVLSSGRKGFVQLKHFAPAKSF